MTIIHEHWEREVAKRFDEYRIGLRGSPEFSIIALNCMYLQDGTNISIQANPYVNCRPKSVEFSNAEDKYKAFYTHWEIWHSEAAEPRGYVPTDEVLAIIAKHGGPTKNNIPATIETHKYVENRAIEI